MAKVGVLIVTYNRLKLLQEEVDSIRQQTYTDFEIIVVDNCSSDDTAKWLDEQKDIYTIHINPDNIGPAKAFSLGMKYIAEQGYEYCWLMDDDVECKPDSLNELVKAYARKDGIGYLCSKVLGIDGCPMNVPKIDQRVSVNGYSNYGDLLEYGMVKVEDSTFVSMFIPCQYIFEKGLPLGEFYNWCVDTEYSMRLSRDKDCYLVGNSIVVHKRLIQKSLSFETETDPVRLSYYRSTFRNNMYIMKLYFMKGNFMKIRIGFKSLKIAMWHCFHFKFKQAFIYINSYIDFLSYNPKINYPIKKS